MRISIIFLNWSSVIKLKLLNLEIFSSRYKVNFSFVFFSMFSTNFLKLEFLSELITFFISDIYSNDVTKSSDSGNVKYLWIISSSKTSSF